ncbi:MAG: hypothetical protein ACWGOX_07995 [Desulforhopalus sp.]
MKNTPKACLSCKFFRPKDILAGICRVDKDHDRNYPAKQKDECCARWVNCGQQYYIRVGWIRAQTAKVNGGDRAPAANR